MPGGTFAVMGRREKDFVGIAPLDPEVGKPLYEAARHAYEKGSRLWTCMIVVASYLGAPVKIHNRATATVRVSPDDLLNAIEGLGWRLEHLDHVYVQTTTTANAGFAGMAIAGVSGQVEAHYVFRRVETT
jgi:hypothetical protein